MSASWRIRNAASAAAGREVVQVALHLQRDVEPGAPQLGHQVAGALHRRHRVELGLGAVRAQDPEQPPHLADRVAAGPLDGEQRLALALLLRRQQPPHGARLQPHDADAVPDHVVQLAGDPRPLGLHRRPRPLVALALEHGGAGLEHVDLEAHRPRRAAHEERDRDADRVERELLGGPSRDHHRGAELAEGERDGHDGPAHARVRAHRVDGEQRRDRPRPARHPSSAARARCRARGRRSSPPPSRPARASARRAAAW